jgi:CubicO group peptidase (beta-lactamase class C family)
MESHVSDLPLAAPEAVGFSAARLQRIDTAMARAIERGQVVGGVTLVARHGRVAHLAAHGQRDREAGAPMRPDTIFRISSMTKPVTVAAVMMLFEAGHFLLDDPVADFLPEFAQTKVFAGGTGDGGAGGGDEGPGGGPELAELERPITIRHLLMHTAGLTYGDPKGHAVARRYAAMRIERWDEPLEEKVPRLARQPLVHQPGSAWTYGLSHDVLGRLVEVVAGQPFDVFLREQLFAPLGMADTGFHVPPHDVGRLAAAYTPDEQGGLRRAEGPWVEHAQPRRFLSGGGGLVSTAADYARFCQMLLNGGALDGTRLLGPKTVQLLAANQMAGQPSPFPAGPLPGGAGWRMALGLATLVDPVLAGLPASAGAYCWAGALSTYFWIDPQEELFGVFLVQRHVPRHSFAARRVYAGFPVLVYQALVA